MVNGAFPGLLKELSLGCFFSLAWDEELAMVFLLRMSLIHDVGHIRLRGRRLECLTIVPLPGAPNVGFRVRQTLKVRTLGCVRRSLLYQLTSRRLAKDLG